MKAFSVSVISFVFGISLLSSCATINSPILQKEDIRTLVPFKLRPEYNLSPIRIPLIRYASTTNVKTTNSNGSSSTTSVSTSAENNSYEELGVFLGNGLHIDIAGNLYLDIPYIAQFENRTSFALTKKKESFEKKNNIILIKTGNVFIGDKIFEIEGENVYQIKKDKKDLYIEKLPDGHKKYFYAITGAVTNTDRISMVATNKVATIDTTMNSIDVTQIDKNTIEIIEKHILFTEKTIKLEIINENTIKITEKGGLFSPEKIYYLTYGKSMITCADKNGKTISQITLASDTITVNRIIQGSSILMMIFGTNRSEEFYYYRY
jgi:hypothetical protein